MKSIWNVKTMTSIIESSSAQSISANINRLRDTLRLMIDLEHGLLDALRSLGVLSWSQIEVIESLPNDASRIDRMFDFVVCLPLAGLRSFLIALFKTQQTHISNYIVSNGVRPSADEKNWPLVRSKKYSRLMPNYVHLIEVIDPNNGLLEEMLSVGCINFQHMRGIETRSTLMGKNEFLLRLLRKRSIGDFHSFIRCLEKTKQFQAASLSGARLTFANRPLNEKRIKRIKVNYAVLVELIDTREVLSFLVAEKCITRRQHEFIKNTSSATQSNQRLLDIILKGSESDYEKFIECLNWSEQRHVCRILDEEVAVVSMMAKTSRPARTLLYSRAAMSKTQLSADSVKQDEERIVKEFMTLLQKSSAERRRRPLYDQVTSLTNDLTVVKTAH